MRDTAITPVCPGCGSALEQGKSRCPSCDSAVYVRRLPHRASDRERLLARAILLFGIPCCALGMIGVHTLIVSPLRDGRVMRPVEFILLIPTALLIFLFFRLIAMYQAERRREA